jgi:hypothetical protein
VKKSKEVLSSEGNRMKIGRWLLGLSLTILALGASYLGSAQFSNQSGPWIPLFVGVESLLVIPVVTLFNLSDHRIIWRPARFVRGANFVTAARLSLLILFWTLSICSGWVAMFPLGRVARHTGTLAVADSIALLLALCVVLYAAKRAKARADTWRSLILIQRNVLAKSPWYSQGPVSADVLTDSASQIPSVLEALSNGLNEWTANSFVDYSRKLMGIPRLVSIWVPDDQRQEFFCKYRYPHDSDHYEILCRHYFPKMHDREQYVVFMNEWRRRSSENRSEYMARKAGVTSLMGAVWDGLGSPQAQNGDRGRHRAGSDRRSSAFVAYADDLKDFDPETDFLEWTHENFLAFQIRSLYIRRLDVPGKKLGLLVILDPLPHGLLLRDEFLLEGYAHQLELLLARYVHFRHLLEPVTAAEIH